jgi:Flp pilus assembly pilin Flp
VTIRKEYYGLIAGILAILLIGWFLIAQAGESAFW